jgi:hypothetical protein
MDKHIRLLDKAAYYRGYVIHSTLFLEGYLEEILLDYFVPEEKQRILIKFGFFSTEFMSFEKKILLLGMLINNEYNKNKTHLLAYLRDVRDMRNVMGHKMIAESEKHIEGFDGETVHFIISETKDHVPKIKIMKFNEDNLEDFAKKVELCGEQLLELRNKINKKRGNQGEGEHSSKP